MAEDIELAKGSHANQQDERVEDCEFCLRYHQAIELIGQ